MTTLPHPTGPVDPVSGTPAGLRRRRIFLVDDHNVVRSGLAELLNLAPDLQVCGEAATAEEALRTIDAAQPDAAIVDLTLGEMGGLELIKTLKVRMPQLPVLVLSMHDESYYAERCLRAGAKGYIMKKEAIEQLEHAVRQILDGKVHLSPTLSNQYLLAVARGNTTGIGSPVNLLSDRELEIFECIGRGLGATEVARKLSLSVRTIESYQARLKEKLNLKDSSQLFQYALHWVEHH